VISVISVRSVVKIVFYEFIKIMAADRKRR
jgi:hypothetical protein